MILYGYITIAMTESYDHIQKQKRVDLKLAKLAMPSYYTNANTVAASHKLRAQIIIVLPAEEEMKMKD